MKNLTCWKADENCNCEKIKGHEGVHKCSCKRVWKQSV